MNECRAADLSDPLPRVRTAAMTDLVSIGECMVELSRQPDGRFSLAYGGDTFNTAAYAARLGLDVAYGTALGEDPYSRAIFDLAAAEGIVDGDRAPAARAVPGLYVIETDEKGERSFFYWRDAAPARRLFELPESAGLAGLMKSARCIYFLRHHPVALFRLPASTVSRPS